ncbi:NAD(P)-dependent oxidoreductase [Phenylobacterium sp.]|uniref:NAD(P)-dependent oxidoreductase n=1 Tax=Phenylobacterium sp. TaxID=1871053 RepID=UPI002FC72B94
MARILLTGASSFSGLWIAEALVGAGHDVTAPLRRRRGDYEALRADRVTRLMSTCRVVFEAPFASQAFADILEEGFDLLAHHAADIADYRAATYDVVEGVARNVAGADAAFSALVRSGGVGVVVTGTTFEAGEGQSAPGDVAVSPYGLSKTLTNEALRNFARWRGLRFAKFVIAAPFGPLEEGRFAWSLFQRWFAGEPGLVRTPRYIRDNIPSPCLGAAYVALVESVLSPSTPDQQIARPSGIIGSQEAFARLLAGEMNHRLGLECAVETLPQTVLAEPEVRVNSDPWIKPDWPAQPFWDAYAAYYQKLAASGLLAAPP